MRVIRYCRFIYNDPTVRSYFTHMGVVWVRKDSTPLNSTVESKKTWSAAPSKEIPPPLSLDDAENLAIELNAESATAIIDDEDKEAFEVCTLFRTIWQQILCCAVG